MGYLEFPLWLYFHPARLGGGDESPKSGKVRLVLLTNLLTSTSRRTKAAAMDGIADGAVVIAVVAVVVVTAWTQSVVVAIADERVALVAVADVAIAVVAIVVAVVVGTAWWLAEQFAQAIVDVAWVPSGNHDSWSRCGWNQFH